MVGVTKKSNDHHPKERIIVNKRFIVVGLLLTLFSCGSPISSDEATELLVNQLWQEDSLVSATCQELEASHSDQMEGMLNREILPISARREVLRQDVVNVEALFRALEVDLEICPVQSILTSAVPPRISPDAVDVAELAGLSRDDFPVDHCIEHLESLFAELEADVESAAGEGSRRTRIFQALNEAGVAPSDLLLAPFQTARLIDLSPAIVFTVVYFADRMNAFIGDLTDSFGFASGLVELLIEEVAAEILAIAVEDILEELELSGAVSRASVSRTACQLYQTGTTRPHTTVRLLKRMILRFQITPYSEPASRYSVAAFCQQLSGASVCEEMLEELELEDALQGHPETSEESIYEALVPRLSERSPEFWQDAAEWKSYLLLEAALSCGDPCNIDDLNRAASVTLLAWHTGTHPDDLNTFPIAVQPTLWTSGGQISHELHNLRQELMAARNTTSALINLFLVGELSTARLRHELIETVGRLSDCHVELGRVREARIAFANELLVVDPPLTCEGPSQIHQSMVFPGIRVSSAIACDPSQPFDFDIGTEGLFETCQAQPLDEGRMMLESLAADLAALDPKAVVIIGHADQRPIETTECLASFENNTMLSEARAEAVRQLLSNAFDQYLLIPIPFYTTGVGDIDPRVHCGPDADDDCHLQNRRVALRLVGAQGLDFDFSCVGGP